MGRWSYLTQILTLLPLGAEPEVLLVRMQPSSALRLEKVAGVGPRERLKRSRGWGPTTKVKMKGGVLCALGFSAC